MGRPFGTRRRLADRFWEKVDVRGPDDCWEWTASLNPKGYGQISVGRKPISAHILSYEMNVDPVPENMLVCHTCDNRKCVNPKHLYVGTPKSNSQDMVDRGRSGRSTIGEKNPAAKLTELDVLKIRSLVAGGLSRLEVATVFGVQIGAVGKIVRRERWKHV